MDELLNLNKIWIEFISNPPSNDKYCTKFWNKLKWEITPSDFNKNGDFIIKTVYKYGNESDQMQTWTEPFGTSKRFNKWCNKANTHLKKKLSNYKIEFSNNIKKHSMSIYFKLEKVNK